MTTRLEAIKTLQKEIDARERRIGQLRAGCPHEWKPSDPKYPDASSPICSECGQEQDGWWCPTSPTKKCDYTSVTHPRKYNMDHCRYCGQPEERK